MNKVRLGDIAKFQNGKAFKPEQWHDKGLPIIRIQNLNDPEKDYNYHSGEIKPKYHVFDGDILISWSASLGVYEWDRGDAYLNQHIFKTIFKRDDVDKNYFKYMLSLKIEQVEKHLHGSTMKHINKGDFKDLKIPLPPLETQKKIAAVLDKADALRQKRQLTIEKLDKLTQSVFLDMFGNPNTNPKKWAKIKLKDVTKITSGSTPSRKNKKYYGGIIPWVKTGEVSGDFIVNTEEKLTELGIENSSCDIHPVNTILVAMYGQGKTRGNVGLLKIEATTNQACAAIEPCKEIKPFYLFNLLKLQYEYLRSLGRGGNQSNLNVGMIKDYEVISPPIELQEKFARIYNEIHQQYTSYQSSEIKFQNLYYSLLQKAFKGELNFRDSEQELLSAEEVME